MGLMQSAYETYEALSEKYVGDYGQKEVFAPVSHIVTHADIEVTLDLEGRFLGATPVDKEEPKIVIPVTEKSAGRTSAPEPHPLCEQLGYLSGEGPQRREMYIDQLAEWNDCTPHPTLKAVLSYLRQGTLDADLARANLIQRDEKGTVKNNKALIRWRVLGSPMPDCWKDRTLFEAFIRYYNSIHAADQKTICMLDGRIARAASQHPKGVVALNGNAKLISANDSTGFTYRGRFATETQALTVSYEASQKAHAALRWLVANQGMACGGRTFVCWSPQGVEVPQEDKPFLFYEDEPILEASDYYDRLKETLRGWQTKLPPETGVVIAAFDAATTGRLSLTYYSELRASDLLERLYAWDASCCWWNGRFGVQSPALYNIVKYAFGNRRDETRIECDDKAKKQHMQRLIACRIDRAAVPQDIVRALVQKCQSLHLYDDKLRDKLLFTVCAVIRKYHLDQKEEWSLALEPERKDRSYQYGRLLAVLEKAEQDTYDRAESRMTNAIRLQPMYVRQPMHTFNIIVDQLKKAYYPRLHPAIRSRYERLIGEILYIISECPQEPGSGSLSDSYLLGYYLQKKELYTKQNNGEKEEEKA